jgi:hypothetical protein
MSFIARAARAMVPKHFREVCRRMRSALLGLTCLLCLGCGSNMASVSGAVTLDGKPLAGNERLRGTVQFMPEDGHGTTAVGYLDENGHYVLSSGSRAGVLPGKYLVTVSATEIIPPKIPGEAPGGRLVTPSRYADVKNSGFTAEVVHGRNTFDYDLLTQKTR